MDAQVASAIIGIIAALAGSAVGGVTSYVSTRSMRKIEWELSIREKEISYRENLYADFITEANDLVLNSFTQERKENKINKLIALESKIWLHSNEIGPISRKLTTCVLDYVHGTQKSDEPKFAELRDETLTAFRADLYRVKRDT